LSDPIYIFLCSRSTREEVLEKSLVGTTAKDWNRDMRQVRRGSRVLVYDYDKLEFLGPFAVSEVRGGRSLDPSAWGGRFPFQARIRSVGNLRAMPIADVLAQVDSGDLMRPSGTKPKSVGRNQAGSDLAELFDFSELPDDENEDASLGAAAVVVRGPSTEAPVVRTFRTRQGFDVASKAELTIANLLAEWSIECYYDRPIPRNSGYRYDFCLPRHDVYIEYWGLIGDAAYDHKRQVKTSDYNRLGYRLIELEPADERDLEGRLQQQLARFGIDPFAGEARHSSWLRRFLEWLRLLIRRSR
jgi:hypothetical protein